MQSETYMPETGEVSTGICGQIPAMRGADRVGDDALTAEPYRGDAITIAERPYQV